MSDIDDLDKRLRRVAQSTQTFFPSFIRLHDWLRMHSRAYYKWHTNPLATAIHVALLIVVTGFNLLSLSSFILSYPNTAQAASQTWTTQSDWGSWTRSNTSETVSSGSLTLSTGEGAAWATQTSNTSTRLNGVWAASTSDVWAVGDSGTIMHYNGSSWSSVTSPTGQNLNDIYGFSSSDIWAVGNNGVIIHYTGSSWGTVTSNAIYSLRGIWGSSASDIWAVGDMGTANRYNGSAWSSVGSGQSNALYAVWGSSSSDIWAVGTGGATPTTVRYNGSAWSNVFTTLPTTGFYGIWGTSSSNYHATTAQNAQAHYGGSSWAYSYGSPNGAANRYGIWGTSASDIWLVGASGEIQHFNGSAWSASTSNTSTTLRDIFGSSSDVWAVGDSGTIVHYGAGYSSSGTGTKVLSPGGGKTYDWQSATVNKTANGQTATVEYTTNTNCSSDLTTDIASLADSESVCVKISLSTNNSGVTPSVEDISISYAEVSSGSSGTATPSSSSTSSASKAASPSPSPSATLTPTTSIPPVRIKIAKDSCTSEIKDITLTAQDTNALLAFTTVKARTASVYIYSEARSKNSTTSAIGYDVNSVIIGSGNAVNAHSVAIPNLNQETTYYYTVLAQAVAGSNTKIPSCEYSFTTVKSVVASSTALSGNIYENGTTTPVPGAKVVLQRKAADARWVYQADMLSDDKGGFSFEYVPTESYHLLVTQPSGYYYGPTRGDASCQASQRGPNALAWDNGLFLPADGCRVSFFLTKAQESWPAVSGKLLENGKTTGVRDAQITLTTYGTAGWQGLGSTKTDEQGNWSIKYPPNMPISVSIQTSSLLLAGPTKAVYGCKGDTYSVTNSLRWQKTQIPTTGCQNNIFYATVTQPASPPLAGMVKDSITGTGIPDVRVDLYTVVSGENRFAARVYTGKDGSWRFVTKPDTIYRAYVWFDVGHTIGYIPGPTSVTASCEKTKATVSDIQFPILTNDGCREVTFSASPLSGPNSKTLSGYTLKDTTKSPVSNASVRLAHFDALNNNWRVVSELYTSATGQWSFPIIAGQKYFVETRYTPGYLTGHSLPTAACKNTDTKFTHRLTWHATASVLRNDCLGNVMYLMPADGKITGTVSLPNGTLPLFNSLQRIWLAKTGTTKVDSTRFLQYTYSDSKGRFSLDCRKGTSHQYLLKQDPSGSQIKAADVAIENGPGTTRVIKNEARAVYIPIQQAECREPDPINLAVTITPNIGTFEKEVKGITMAYTSSLAKHKAEIRYTINGGTPTNTSALYRDKPISIGRLQQQAGTQQVVIRAKAFGSESEQVEATYSLTAAPTPSPSASSTVSPSVSPVSSPVSTDLDVTAQAAGDRYTEPVTVTLSTNQQASSDITILYSTDGSDPLEGGKTYTAPIVFNSTVTLNYIAKKESTGQQTALKTDVYDFPDTAGTRIVWPPAPGVEPIYTVLCNGEKVIETSQTSYDNPVQQVDGCVYTITAKDKDGNDLGEVKGVTVSVAKPSEPDTASVLAVPVATTVAAAGAAAIATVQPGAIRSLGLIPFLLHSLWLSLISLLGLRKKHTSWGRAYETALDSPIRGAIVSFYRVENDQRQLLDRQLSDTNGQYGFIIAPGHYQIDVKKSGFVFPTHTTVASAYRGATLSITNQTSMTVDLPMDPFELSQQTLGRWRKARLLLTKLDLPILIAGTILTGYDLTKGIAPLSVIVAIMYAALWLNKIKKYSQGKISKSVA